MSTSSNPFTSNNHITGKGAMMWWNDRPVYELEEYNLEVTPVREEDQFVGEMGIDSVITGLKGEGTMTIKKMWSNNFDEYLKAYQNGEDPRMVFVNKVGGDRAYNGQTERISVSNCWLNKLQLASIKNGKQSVEIPFGFNPDSAEYLDKISA